MAGRAKSTQARVNLIRDLFEEYICDGEFIRFSLNLTTLLDCLQIFGSSADTTIATLTYSVIHQDALHYGPIYCIIVCTYRDLFVCLQHIHGNRVEMRCSN